jgi:hypothetical protein
MHRGYEKLTEVRTYPQVTTLINRIDWLGSFANEVPFILAAEQLMEIEAPPRAQYIRTILFELSRIANITLFLGDMGVQLGALTPVFYAFRDREYVLNLIEAVTGGASTRTSTASAASRTTCPRAGSTRPSGHGKMRAFCDEMEDLLVGNEIFQSRTRGIGVIPREIALQLRPVGRQPARAAASTGTCAATDAADGVEQGRLEGLDPPRRRQLRPLLGAPAGDARGDARSSTSCSTRCRRADHGQGAAHHQGARGRGLGRHREPARRDGLLRRLQGRHRAVPREDPLGQLQQHLDRAVGAAGVYVPDVITILASLYFILGTSTDERSSSRVRAIPYWGRRSSASGVPARRADPGGHARLPVLFKMMSFMQSRLGRWRPALRLDAAVRRGRQVAAEGGHASRAGRPRIFKRRRLVVLSTFLIYVVVPFGPTPVRRTRRGIFFALAVSSVSVLGILMAGWASANKYSLHGRPAGRRPADRLRAADGARRRRRGHPGRHAEHAGHRAGPGRRRRSSAWAASATPTSSPSSSASASS